jgi:hypothetical protein
MPQPLATKPTRCLRRQCKHRKKGRAKRVGFGFHTCAFLFCFRHNEIYSERARELFTKKKTYNIPRKYFLFISIEPKKTSYPQTSYRYPVPYTLYPTPYTLHPTPYTLYPIPYTLYPIPYTLYPIPYTLYPILYTLYPIPYTLYPLPFTLYPIPCTLYPIPHILHFKP